VGGGEKGKTRVATYVFPEKGMQEGRGGGGEAVVAHERNQKKGGEEVGVTGRRPLISLFVARKTGKKRRGGEKRGGEGGPTSL